MAVSNMTSLIQNHTDILEQASVTTFGLQENLNKAASAAKLWNEAFDVSKPFNANIVRFSLPIVVLMLGNYGLAPSLLRNFGLLTSGKFFLGMCLITPNLSKGWMVAELIIRIRNGSRFYSLY